jgi:hypothetical protein
MTALDSSSLNIKAIKALYSSDPVAKVVLDEFASRQRNQQKTKLDQLLLRLSNAGKAAPRTEVINVLRKLAEYGCGDFITGRKGHPTRFEWQYDLVSVGKAAAGGNQAVEEIQPVDETDIVDEEGAEAASTGIEHRYRLRADWIVEITLPSDLTAREAMRFSEFIKTLPFDAPEA